MTQASSDVLFAAIRTGDCQRVASLVLNSGTVREKGYTPLMCAVVHRQKEMLPILIPTFSGVSNEGEYAITMAADMGFIEAVLQLLPYEHQYRNKIGDSAFHILVRRNVAQLTSHCMQYLERARDAQTRTPLELAAELGYLDIVQAIMNTRLTLTVDDVVRAFCAARHAGMDNTTRYLSDFVDPPADCCCYRCAPYYDECRTPLSHLSISSCGRTGSTRSARSPLPGSPGVSYTPTLRHKIASVGIQASFPCEDCMKKTEFYEQMIQSMEKRLAELIEAKERAENKVHEMSSKSPKRTGLIKSSSKPREISSARSSQTRLAEKLTSSLRESLLGSPDITRTTPLVRSRPKSANDKLHGSSLVNSLIASTREAHPQPLVATLRLKESRGEEVEKMSDLMRAACTGNVDTIMKLLATQSGHQTLSGQTALMFASRIGNLSAVRILAHYEICLTTNSGMTALMEACEKGHGEIAELLLAEGGMVRQDGRTALMWAASTGLGNIVQKLITLEAGRRDSNGVTALMQAVEHNQYSCVSLLLDVEVHIARADGKTALDIARERHLDGIILLIETRLGRGTSEPTPPPISPPRSGEFTPPPIGNNTNEELSLSNISRQINALSLSSGSELRRSIVAADVEFDPTALN
ncbi:Ankyrin repeat protein 1 [Giardia muris]|uniref:Ankyrin repeat protein 1 n=1 Tax=Giardia muris TaxID=5742 RepID=A0A4Z1SXV6_GIAMU|nr:Ankyrin repeat protein 1 [Giardia muris]|eukprot:TNJ28348.1 Ankyrin repeat protein 1 [Giardia muris]